MTALVIGTPSCASAVAFIFCKTMAETCSGAKSFFSPLTSTEMTGLPPSPSRTSNGINPSSSPHSLYWRPMMRLTLNKVFFGLMAAWRLAASPTRRPCSVNATQDGVVRSPSAFVNTCASPFLHTDTHEYVVPRSIPMTCSSSETLSISAASLAASIFCFCANLASPKPSIKLLFFGSTVKPRSYALMASCKKPALKSAKPRRE